MVDLIQIYCFSSRLDPKVFNLCNNIMDLNSLNNTQLIKYRSFKLSTYSHWPCAFQTFEGRDVGWK